MTPNQSLVNEIKKMIYELPPELEDAVFELAEHFRYKIQKAGPTVGTLAISLIGAEIQEKLDSKEANND